MSEAQTEQQKEQEKKKLRAFIRRFKKLLGKKLLTEVNKNTGKSSAAGLSFTNIFKFKFIRFLLTMLFGRVGSFAKLLASLKKMFIRLLRKNKRYIKWLRDIEEYNQHIRDDEQNLRSKANNGSWILSRKHETGGNSKKNPLSTLLDKAEAVTNKVGGYLSDGFAVMVRKLKASVLRFFSSNDDTGSDIATDDVAESLASTFSTVDGESTDRTINPDLMQQLEGVLAEFSAVTRNGNIQGLSQLLLNSGLRKDKSSCQISVIDDLQDNTQTPAVKTETEKAKI